MTLAQGFEDHLKLAARFSASKPLRANADEPSSAVALSTELRILENSDDFNRLRRSFDTQTFDKAKYAIDALFDALAEESARMEAKGSWDRRTEDPHAGHNFYRNLLDIAEGNSGARNELLKLYSLCVYLGFEGDHLAKAQEGIRRALRESVQASTPAELPVAWPDWHSPDYDSRIATAHRWIRMLAPTALAIYIVGAFYLYFIAWFNFP